MSSRKFFISTFFCSVLFISKNIDILFLYLENLTPNWDVLSRTFDIMYRNFDVAFRQRSLFRKGCTVFYFESLIFNRPVLALYNLFKYFDILSQNVHISCCNFDINFISTLWRFIFKFRVSYQHFLISI